MSNAGLCRIGCCERCYRCLQHIFSLSAELIRTASLADPRLRELVTSPWREYKCGRMESVRKVPRSFELGGCTVNPEDGSLTSPGRSVRLEPLQMDLLVFLCSRAGQVVTKDEILETVWRGRFISDDTVKSTFYQLRKALNDSPRKPRYIETIPKRGYRVLIDPIPLERPGGSRTPGTIATDLFRKGAALLSGQPGAAALKQARLYFERAIESDPDHAESGPALAPRTFTSLHSPLAKDRIFCRVPRRWRRVLQKTIRSCRALARSE